MTKIHVLLFLFFPFLYCSGQIVNGYASVIGITGNTITLNNVDEAFDTFENGETVILMQIQDDVIGTNISDNSNFGLLGNINSAGLYEFITVSSHTEVSGSPVSINFSGSLINSYNTGSNSSLMLITFPTLGSPDYTSGNLSAKPWDGNTGGILAFNVTGTLSINGSITADEIGFRGANPNGGGSTGCTGGSVYRIATTNNHADKGEGIYKISNANYQAGRARILNAGGGGNSHNAGGGGGGNFSAGGTGGPGWPNCSPTAGGMGGIDLSSHISASRVFLGGAGGAGEGNNGGSRKAGNGGGIIFIKANTIETIGTCATGHQISANGESITIGSGGDGNSGGGAGGSIVIEVNNWNISPTCPLTVSSNGGNGGNVTHSAGHGAGGGGGQGVVIYSIAQPTSNTTTITNNGTGGLNCNTCGTANSGAGTNNNGIIDLVSGPLPIELIAFNANLINPNHINIYWQTLSEIDNKYFVIEKSKNLDDWYILDSLKGKGNSSELTLYNSTDNSPYKPKTYYRLKQIDTDNSYEYYGPIYIDTDMELVEPTDLNVFPNPSHNSIIISNLEIGKDIKIYDLSGRLILEISNPNQETSIDIHDFSKGTYIIKQGYKSTRFMKK